MKGAYIEITLHCF